MKTLAAVTMAAMITTAASAGAQNYFPDSARYACVNAEKAAESYRTALSSPNRGVAESALAHVAMIKLELPGCDLASIRPVVSALEIRGATEELRYKAWVVATLLDHPAMFADVSKGRYNEPDALFAALAATMAEKYTAR